MTETISLLALAILGLIIWWLTNELKKSRQINVESTTVLSSKQYELEQLQFKLVEANTDVRSLRERLEQERSDNIIKQKNQKNKLN